ncbi:troponin T, slow skeletal muscle-like isoform X2 [Gadus macrocephalus]|uniref:troponin T, slow skeletal muscle-like isoform X2 n=1 Tax=Gadus macrocephalus TaxID=80720 RepID=UPI0028CB6BB6|nr:troponin T, slow skeletal muscle-like isoform X2 [Gadus macrocephalus]
MSLLSLSLSVCVFVFVFVPGKKVGVIFFFCQNQLQSINVPQGSLKTQYFYDRIFFSSEVEEEQEADEELPLEVEEPPTATEEPFAAEEDDVRPKAKFAPNITVPKPSDGDKVDFDDIHRKRQDKDLGELQSLIDAHFIQRKKEEEELVTLVQRIENRRTERAEQQRIRADQEKERQIRLADEKEKREQGDVRKKQDDDLKKKKVLTNMSVQYGGLDSKKGAKKQTGREKKRKILSDRRKPLVMENLNEDKVKEKASELWKWLKGLEAEKFDLCEVLKKQKYDINVLQNRVSEQQKFAKGRGKAKGRLR